MSDRAHEPTFGVNTPTELWSGCRTLLVTYVGIVVTGLVWGALANGSAGEALAVGVFAVLFGFFPMGFIALGFELLTRQVERRNARGLWVWLIWLPAGAVLFAFCGLPFSLMALNAGAWTAVGAAAVVGTVAGGVIALPLVHRYPSPG